MVHGTQTFMRFASGDAALRKIQLTCGNVFSIAKTQYNKGKGVYLFELRYTAAFSNGYAEIGAPNAVFDGTSTAAVVYVDSTSANDSSTGVGAQEVTILGIDENDNFVAVAVATGGTTGQSSVTKFKRIFHAYVSAAGANNDAEGDIYVQDDATGTTKYLKIAAGTVESEGSALFVPTGIQFSVALKRLIVVTAANATAALLVKAAAINTTSVGGDPDLAYIPIRATSASGDVVEQATGPATAVSGCKLTFSETYTGNQESGFYQAVVVLWEV